MTRLLEKKFLNDSDFLSLLEGFYARFVDNKNCIPVTITWRDNKNDRYVFENSIKISVNSKGIID